MIYYKTQIGGENVKLTFPYIFKADNTQKDIIEEIMWHCEKVYNILNAID